MLLIGDQAPDQDWVFNLPETTDKGALTIPLFLFFCLKSKASLPSHSHCKKLPVILPKKRWCFDCVDPRPNMRSMVGPVTRTVTTYLQNGEAAQEDFRLPGFCQVYVIQIYWLRASFLGFCSQVRYFDVSVGVWCMFWGRELFSFFFLLSSF